jgi:hypothetical protein
MSRRESMVTDVRRADTHYRDERGVSARTAPSGEDKPFKAINLINLKITMGAGSKGEAPKAGAHGTIAHGASCRYSGLLCGRTVLERTPGVPRRRSLRPFPGASLRSAPATRKG